MVRPLLLPLILVAALPAVHGTATNCPVGTWETGGTENFYREPACKDGHLCQIKVTTAEDKKLAKKEGACVAACGVDTGKCMILKGTVIVECCLDDEQSLENALYGLAMDSLALAKNNGTVTIDAASLTAAAKIVKGVEVGEKYHFKNIRHSLTTFYGEPKTPGSISNPNPKPESAVEPDAPPPPAPPKDSPAAADSPKDEPAPPRSGKTSAESHSAATATLAALTMTVAAIL